MALLYAVIRRGASRRPCGVGEAGHSGGWVRGRVGPGAKVGRPPSFWAAGGRAAGPRSMGRAGQGRAGQGRAPISRPLYIGMCDGTGAAGRALRS
nr:MAG TPA: hypothetical protein [Caudoviricetes sp.]